ncbi:unnamed protein product [Spodoptera exigua]|nr:unnamed protein product [Spodoptera exigua]
MKAVLLYMMIKWSANELTNYLMGCISLYNINKTVLESQALDRMGRLKQSDTTVSQKTGVKPPRSCVSYLVIVFRVPTTIMFHFDSAATFQALGIEQRCPTTENATLQSASKGSTLPDQNQPRAYSA